MAYTIQMEYYIIVNLKPVGFKWSVQYLFI